MNILLQFVKKKGESGRDLKVERDENSDTNRFKGIVQEAHSGEVKVIMGGREEDKSA